jgi:Mn2+/Fe2+ NRAMP family transporter
LFAIGLVGTGILAVPVLTGSASYALAETFGWKYGLDEKPHRAPRFYLTIAVATLVGMLLNFINVNPITALFWTAVLNGLLAPPLLVCVMLVSSNPKVMNDRVNGRTVTLLGWATTVVMFLSAIALVLTWKQ